MSLKPIFNSAHSTLAEAPPWSLLTEPGILSIVWTYQLAKNQLLFNYTGVTKNSKMSVVFLTIPPEATENVSETNFSLNFKTQAYSYNVLSSDKS